MTTTGSILILHDVADTAGGAPWRTAFGEAGYSQIFAPDLPGHGDAPDPLGGTLEATDAAFVAAKLFATAPVEHVNTIVGIGISGWSAQLFALAGRCDRLVLVNGLGDPFLSVEEILDRRFARMRMAAATSDSLHGAPPYPHSDADLAHRAAAEMPVPVLLLASAADIVRTLAPAFAAGATSGGDSAAPADVAAEVAAWADK